MIQKRRKRAGYTVLEIAIVVTIIGILAVIVIPASRRAVLRSRDVHFMNNLRLLTGDTLQLYSFRNGDYPLESPVGVEPAGLANLLPRRFVWAEATAIGGNWDWDRAADRSQKVDGLFYAGLTVVNPARTAAQMQDIDSKIDDGNLSTGVFRRRGLDHFTYILEF